MSDWRERRREERRQKDMFFAEHPKSPISEDRAEFEGLSYYPLDETYRFRVELKRDESPETVTVPTTDDGTQTYERCGRFEFTLHGVDCRLWAYRSEADNRLWVPFRDATNGAETYGGGRYIDLEQSDRDGDAWLLDFNTAYTPYCAFTEAYECPLVPEANTLEVPVEAGEQWDSEYATQSSESPDSSERAT